MVTGSDFVWKKHVKVDEIRSNFIKTLENNISLTSFSNENQENGDEEDSTSEKASIRVFTRSSCVPAKLSVRSASSIRNYI